jgi:hypothetical protein
MKIVNQILVTLKEADTFARSQNPHHHRLALLLLDNIIELQLRRKSDTAFAYADMTWFSGPRKHSGKQRKKVSRNHADLLALAVAEKWITEDESNLLALAHRIRNRAYHEGDSEDKVDLQIGITLLYRLIRRHFPVWRNGWNGLQEFPNAAIPVADVAQDKSGHSPLLFGFEGNGGYYNFLSEEHWVEVLKRCLMYDDSADIRPLIKRRIDNLLEDVEGWVNVLTEDDNQNFVPALADRFSKITHVFCCCPKVSKARIGPAGALNIYLAVLDDEERLLDIEDEQERDKEFHKLVGDHQFQPDVLSSLDLEPYREIAETVLERTEAEGITHFLTIEKDLKKIGRAARECGGDLDLHLEREADIRRGK